MTTLKNNLFQDVPREVAAALLPFKLEESVESLTEDEIKKRMATFFNHMGGDIMKQKKRLGGTFAVAFAVPDRRARDYVRSLLGPDLVFIVLNITRECQAERIKKRHGENVGDHLEKLFSRFRPADEDEEGAYNVTVEKGMTKEDVLQQVMEVVKSIK